MEIPERPKFNDEIRTQLAEEMAPYIQSWDNSNGSTNSLQQIEQDMFDILEFHHDDNGYDLAKEFEDKGYQPNIDLVEILDCVGSRKRTLINKATKDWVIKYEIKPSLSIDHPCTVKYSGEWVDGVVTDIRKETAEYLVMIPSEGMTMADSRRAIINYENAKPYKGGIFSRVVDEDWLEASVFSKMDELSWELKFPNSSTSIMVGKYEDKPGVWISVNGQEEQVVIYEGEYYLVSHLEMLCEALNGESVKLTKQTTES